MAANWAEDNGITFVIVIYTLVSEFQVILDFENNPWSIINYYDKNFFVSYVNFEEDLSCL